MKPKVSDKHDFQASHELSSHEAPTCSHEPVGRLPARSARGVRRQQVYAAAGASPSPVAGIGYPWQPYGRCEVERLAIWAYGAQRVGDELNPFSGLLPMERQAAGGETFAPSGDGCWMIGQRHQIGASIDVSRGPMKDSFHPAALAVADAVQRVDGGALVAHWARIGVRPGDWATPDRWIVPRVWKGDSGETAHGGANGKLLFTPVRLARSVESLAVARLEYGRWHAALLMMWHLLSGRALGFVVSPPEAPAAPWDIAAARLGGAA